jgi:hypothetical protein
MSAQPGTPSMSAQPGTPSMSAQPGTAWDSPPLGDPRFDETVAAKTPWYKLAPKKSKSAPDSVSAAAPTAVAYAAAATVETPSETKAPWYKLAPKKSKGTPDSAGTVAPVAAPAAGPVFAAAPPTAATVEAPSETKAPWYKLAPKKSKAAPSPAAAAAGAAYASPTDAAPMTVQPPPPVMGSPTTAPPAPQPGSGPVVPGQNPYSGYSGTDDPSVVVLAGSGARGRRSKIALVILLVLVVGGGAWYFVSKRSNTTTPPAAVAPVTPAGSPTAVDSALAASINLHLADLPAGWTVAPPAQAVVRPPVAPAATQAAASNTMAACLNTSYSVVSGLFNSGSVPGQTSLVASATYQSAAGSAFEMGSRTMTMSSPGQVQAIEPLFTNPKFDACYQQYLTTMVAGAVPGATVAIQSVSLTSPTGVQSFGVISTYTIPRTGTEVVGDAFMLGGRVISVLQPTTNGPAIESSVFTPAYDAVAARVAKAPA